VQLHDLHDLDFGTVRISCWSRDHTYIEAFFKPELPVKRPTNPECYSHNARVCRHLPAFNAYLWRFRLGRSVTKKRNRMTKVTINEIMSLNDWGVFGAHDDAEDDDDEDTEDASSTAATNSTRGPGL
jgi:hypothetical protein